MPAKKKPTKKKAQTKYKLLLPRALSSTGLDLWERDPDEYAKKYFEGIEPYENDAMRFGKHISNVLCGKEKPADHIEQSVKLLCKQYGNQEYEIRVDMPSNYGPIPLVGFLDDIEDVSFLDIVETKTGTTKWTQRKAENHGQLHYYYLLVLLHKSIRARRAWLQHFETVLDETRKYGRKLTGKITTFEVYLEVGHEIEIRRRIENAAFGIDKAYRAYLARCE